MLSDHSKLAGKVRDESETLSTHAIKIQGSSGGARGYASLQWGLMLLTAVRTHANDWSLMSKLQ